MDTINTAVTMFHHWMNGSVARYLMIVCVCVRACVRACVLVCMGIGTHKHTHTHTHTHTLYTIHTLCTFIRNICNDTVKIFNSPVTEFIQI